MSHPKNKHERVVVGTLKGKKRANGYFGNRFGSDAFKERQCQLRRDTTKLCSCAMCGNARRHFGELTMQEKRFYCGMDWSGSSPVS